MKKTGGSSLAAYGPGERGKTHFAIVVKRTPTEVRAVTLYEGYPGRVTVSGVHAVEFDKWFSPTPNTPVSKLADLFLAHAKNAGATIEALDVLGDIVKIDPKEYERMVSVGTTLEKTASKPKSSDKKAEPKTATSKVAETKSPSPKAPVPKTAAKAVETVVKAAAKTAEKKTEPKATKAATKTAAKPKAVEPKPYTGKVPTPSTDQKVGSYTQVLIKLGMSNDEILDQLDKHFSDKTNTAANVAWYRNKLRKEGSTGK